MLWQSYRCSGIPETVKMLTDKNIHTHIYICVCVCVCVCMYMCIYTVYGFADIHYRFLTDC